MSKLGTDVADVEAAVCRRCRAQLLSAELILLVISLDAAATEALADETLAAACTCDSLAG